MNGEHNEDDIGASVDHVFDQFVTAVTCKSVLSTFQQLLDLTGLRHADHSQFYQLLKAKLKGSWKAQSLWLKLDKRASHKDYKRGQACKNTRVLVIGAGPCGLRTAIECAFLGAKTVLVEKRDRFSRNNVLHLWPFLITDLKNLGAKKFFGKFCAGAIDHISIRQLQCILLKVALLLGVEVHVNVSFDGLLEPPEDQKTGIGWRCKATPKDHALSEYVFDVLIGADGKRNTLPGFNRKEFRGKLAIAITANFINRNSQAEARVEEISGVAFIFNQKFFLDLKASTRIDLENIVYYKDDTHYFVMTAKKASLLEKGVLKQDFSDTIALLDRSNVNQDALLAFAKEAANFSTNYQMPSMDYAVNHYGQADVAMFDFTSMFAAENASRFLLKNGHHLLMGLVGDSLLEPFWPTGSGCARGFLSAFDAGWMIRNWAMGKSPIQVLSERESVFTVLSQTTPSYLHKNFHQYSIDPNTRYPNLNIKCVKPMQVRHLYEGGTVEIEEEDMTVVPTKKPRNVEPSIDSYSLLRWCQRVLNTGKYRDVHVVDFTSSWRSGLALCALIHSFRPEIIDNSTLMEFDVLANNRLAFSVAERELGISPVMSAENMARPELPDKLTMISYLSQFYEVFKHQPLPSSIPPMVKAKKKSLSRDQSKRENPKSPRSPNKRYSFLQKLSAKIAKSKKRKESEDLEEKSLVTSKKLRERQELMQKEQQVELTRYNKLPMDEIANRLQVDGKPIGDLKKPKDKTSEDMMGAVSVTEMAHLLAAKFKSNEIQAPPDPVRRMKGQPTLPAASPASEYCLFCHKRVYIVERMSAEGEFFHRNCFRCDYCGVGLRLNNYTPDRDAKPVKFYCYRHALAEQRPRPQRKRGFEDELKENIPQMVVIPPSDDTDLGQASKEKSPRKATPPGLSPLALPTDVTDKPTKTPERVEFEISFDGQEEESEEEQFEHNLRASLSSDTLLDDEDDSDSSSSELESGAEEEVWENAVESKLYKPPGSPLTLEQASELFGSLRRHHSKEHLLDAMNDEDRTPCKGKGYVRLGDDNGKDDESSSTEMEDDSEYDTDDSSASEESDDEKTAPGHKISHGEHNGDSSKTPSSPMTRLSASKASFFSEPQRVVSLDPFSMFGMGNKKSVSDENRNNSATPTSSNAKNKKSDSKKESSSKVTDVSESLELDYKNSESLRDKAVGSLDDLSEELNSELVEDVRDNDGGIDGDDEREEMVGKENDQLVKTAASRAMEQLLLDMDHSKDSSTEPPGDTSDSADNSGFIEGRLSPSANKTRKFRMKRAVRRSKEQRRSSIPTTSESEAGRTDPTTTDYSRSQSSMSLSRSPSADIDALSSNVRVLTPPDGNKVEKSPSSVSLPIEKEQPSVVNRTTPESDLLPRTEDTEALQKVLDSIVLMPDLSDDSDIDDLVEENADEKHFKDLIPKNKVEKVDIKPTVNVDGVLDNKTKNITPSFLAQPETVDLDQDTERLQKVLDSIVCMPDLSEDSDIDDVVIQNVDEKKEEEKINVTPTSNSVGRIDDNSNNATPSSYLAVPEMSDLEYSGTLDETETLQKVLEGIICMPDLSDNSDIDDVVIQNVDDRFVTDRRAKRKKSVGKKKSKPSKEKSLQKETDAQLNSSFSISTPSDSEESVSSIDVDDARETFLDVKPEDDHLQPDADMMLDYQNTMSLVLGESYSDDHESGCDDEKEGVEERMNLDNNLSPGQAEISKSVCSESNQPTIDTSSLYATPNQSADQAEALQKVLDSIELRPDLSDDSDIDELVVQNADERFTTKIIPKKEDEVIKSSPIPLQRPLPLPRHKKESPKPSPIAASLPAFTPSTDPVSQKTPQSPVSVKSLNQDNRVSSGSEIFLSPAESFAESPISKYMSHTPQTKEADYVNRRWSLPPKDSPVVKAQRKLPDLPKLNIPSQQPPRKAPIYNPDKDSAVDPPAMCSSPKPVKRGKIWPAATPDSTSISRPLPIPNISKSSETKAANSVSSNTPTSSKIYTKPVHQLNQESPFNKAITPPVFKLPSKTTIPIDKSKLRNADSDLEIEGKKKISTEGIAIENGLDDIPFADESEAEEKFYTPLDPSKVDRQKFYTASKDDAPAKRRLLPSPPTVGKGEPSTSVTLEKRKADREQAKQEARERARLKSDKELGLGDSTPVKSRHIPEGVQVEDKNGFSDTPNTSDVLSEGEDRIFSTPVISITTEQQKSSGKKGKKKVKTPKTPKTKKSKDSEDSEKKEKRKSLLALILPTKSSEKNQRATTDSDVTPKGSDDNSKTKKKNKHSKGEKKKKSKPVSSSKEELDKIPSVEGKKDLAICSVFHSEASSRPDRTRQTVSLAPPKASGEEFSDSDESHISISTMQRRRDEDLDERVARRLKKIQQKQQRQAEQKRLRMAQEIQRQLEEVEVRQRELEERGITVERALRGDEPDEDIDESQLMSEWFTLVHEKNALLRYESELNVRAKELELEDRQARLELDFRERSRLPDKSGGPVQKLRKSEKSSAEKAAEGNLLEELLEVVEQRNTLVAMLEEDRLREQKEDDELKEMMVKKGFVLSPLSYETRRERQKIEAPLASMAL